MKYTSKPLKFTMGTCRCLAPVGMLVMFTDFSSGMPLLPPAVTRGGTTTIITIISGTETKGKYPLPRGGTAVGGAASYDTTSRTHYWWHK